MAIRYNKSLERDIQRVVRNFNNKITRLEKINDELGIYDLPDKVSIRKIRKEFTNRSELNRYLKNLSLFSSRNIEDSIETESGLMSRYDYELLKREQKRLKSYYTRKIHSYENLSPHIAGVKQTGTLTTLGDEYLQELQAKRKYLEKDITKLSKDQLENFIKSLGNSTKSMFKAEVLYDNYLDDMLFKLGYAVNYDREKIDYIRKKLKELSPQQFDRAMRIESALQTVTDYYSDIHSETALNQNIKDINDKYDLLYENIDLIVEQAKTGYNV